MIYSSYYRGGTKGYKVSISLRPPSGWAHDHELLFAPNENILNGWNNSKKTQQVWDYIYVPQFKRLLLSRQAAIAEWIEQHKKNSYDQTLLCYEFPHENCHRHLVGDFIKKIDPEVWGGEVYKNSERKEEKVEKEQSEIPTLTAKPIVGDKIEIYNFLRKRWVKAIVTDVHAPQALIDQGQGRFSYILVICYEEGGSYPFRIYSLTQARLRQDG